MSHDCTDVELLLGRGEDLLVGEERARLVNHLRACDACRDDDGALRSVVALMQRPRQELSEAARERALAAAFEGAERTPAVEAPRRRAVGPMLALAAVAAAALLTMLRFGAERAPAPVPPVPVAMHGLDPVTPVLPAVTATPAPTVPHDAEWIDAEVAQTHRFAHAEVTLRAGTRARFDEAAHTLELARGEVQVAVDPRPHAPFAVTTQHLRVEVLGTVFTVAPTRVTVQRGRVRVFDARGAVVAAALSAGQSYPTDDRAHRPTPATQAAHGDVLRDVRAALARGDAAGARALLQHFHAVKSRPAEQAEAGTLRAECALLERDLPAAMHAYLDVAERFPTLAAGENAAFAAAQLAARQHDARTRALFARYLSSYPQGRFAADARAALARE